MLRLLVLILLLANGLYFAWSQGYLRDYGWEPAPQSEPQRLDQQVKPQVLRILNATEAQRAQEQAAAASAQAAASAATAEASAPAPALPAASAPLPVPVPPITSEVVATECWQAGPFVPAQAAALRKALEARFPAQAWQLQPEPVRWLVYMGRYPTMDALLKKRKELGALNLQFEAIRNPALEPGLSLGAFTTPEQAQAELARVGQRGVRTAKVVREVEEGNMVTLKLPALAPSERPKLQALTPALAGKTLQSCG